VLHTPNSDFICTIANDGLLTLYSGKIGQLTEYATLHFGRNL